MYIGPWQEFKLAQAIKLKNKLNETELKLRPKLSQEELINHNKRIPPAVKPGASDTASIASGHSRATFNVDSFYDQWVRLERIIARSEHGDTIRKPAVPKQSIWKRNSLNAQRQRINKMRNMYGLNKQLPPISPKRNGNEQDLNIRPRENEESKSIALANKDFHKKNRPLGLRENAEEPRKIESEEDLQRKFCGSQQEEEENNIGFYKRHTMPQTDSYRHHIHKYPNKNNQSARESFHKTSRDRKNRETIQPVDFAQHKICTDIDRNEITHNLNINTTSKNEDNDLSGLPKQTTLPDDQLSKDLHTKNAALGSDNTQYYCGVKNQEQMEYEEIEEDLEEFQPEESIHEEFGQVDGLLQWVEELPEELSASSTDFYVKNILL